MFIQDQRCRRWQQHDFYRVLGLPKDATLAQVKQAFRRVALECHPDRVADYDKEMATSRFQLIHEAYEVLSSESARRQYDLLRKLMAQGRAPPKPKAAPIPKAFVGAPRCECCRELCPVAQARNCHSCAARGLISAICRKCEACAACTRAAADRKPTLPNDADMTETCASSNGSGPGPSGPIEETTGDTDTSPCDEPCDEQSGESRGEPFGESCHQPVGEPCDDRDRADCDMKSSDGIQDDWSGDRGEESELGPFLPEGDCPMDEVAKTTPKFEDVVSSWVECPANEVDGVPLEGAPHIHGATPCPENEVGAASLGEVIDSLYKERNRGDHETQVLHENHDVQDSISSDTEIVATLDRVFCKLEALTVHQKYPHKFTHAGHRQMKAEVGNGSAPASTHSSDEAADDDLDRCPPAKGPGDFLMGRASRRQKAPAVPLAAKGAALGMALSGAQGQPMGDEDTEPELTQALDRSGPLQPVDRTVPALAQKHSLRGLEALDRSGPLQPVSPTVPTLAHKHNLFGLEAVHLDGEESPRRIWPASGFCGCSKMFCDKPG